MDAKMNNDNHDVTEYSVVWEDMSISSTSKAKIIRLFELVNELSLESVLNILETTIISNQPVVQPEDEIDINKFVSMIRSISDDAHITRSSVERIEEKVNKLLQRQKCLMNHQAANEAKEEASEETEEKKDDEELNIHLRSEYGTEEAFYENIAKPVFYMAKTIMEMITPESEKVDLPEETKESIKEAVDKCENTVKLDELYKHPDDDYLESFYEVIFGKKAKKKKKKCKKCAFKDECDALKARVKTLAAKRDNTEIKFHELNDFDLDFLFNKLKEYAKENGKVAYVPGVGMVGYAMMKDRQKEDTKDDDKKTDDKEAEKCSQMFDCSSCHQDKCSKCPDNKEENNGENKESE